MRIVLMVAGLVQVCFLWASDPAQAEVDKIFAEWDKPDSPGCALGVIRDGKLIYARGYGMANLEYNIPIKSDSVFRIGSTSKQFAAMAMALLAEEGKVSLDDDIRKYMPELPEYEAPITIRHLIHHTSGLRDYLGLMSMSGLRDNDWYTDEEVVAMLARQKNLNFKPGEKHLYSNSGYFLLSQIIKRASGKSLREYAHEHIFKPLGMNNSHFHDNFKEIVPKRASGYLPTEDGFEISMTTLEMCGDGGVFTTIDDLLKWDANFYNNRLGKTGPALIKQALTPGVLNDKTQLSYAFGLTVAEHKGLKVVQHGGAFVGFRAQMIRFPEQKFSVIVLCNLGSMNPNGLAFSVADLYLGDAYPAQPANASPEKVAKFEADPSLFKALVGSYLDQEDHSIMTIALKDNQVVRRIEGRPDVALFPISQWSFQYSDRDLRLEFQREGNGEVSGMRLVSESFHLNNPYKKIVRHEPTAEENDAAVGRYYSSELDVTYTLAREGKGLVLKAPGSDPMPLTVWVKGEYSGPYGLRLAMESDGFLLHAGRVRNLKFVKQ